MKHISLLFLQILLSSKAFAFDFNISPGADGRVAVKQACLSGMVSDSGSSVKSYSSKLIKQDAGPSWIIVTATLTNGMSCSCEAVPVYPMSDNISGACR